MGKTPSKPHSNAPEYVLPHSTTRSVRLPVYRFARFVPFPLLRVNAYPQGSAESLPRRRERSLLSRREAPLRRLPERPEYISFGSASQLAYWPRQWRLLAARWPDQAEFRSKIDQVRKGLPTPGCTA